ncbi:unnamed protein product [Darwinula stevensoni]|uniref:Ankyrin repeat domain-containing protein n=1 Tax=Darwinula stevensoni TaxID=69355 RepID=A0A7R8X3D3_9CRUS|nr:unnamed protein product [Darwinula stevensoni]CAG0882409.1 unnamed protein product [Darwinula stevensoni]
MVYIRFTYSVSDDGAQLLEVDHDRREVYSVDLGIRELEGEMMPTQDAVEGRLSSPIVTTYVNTDKISFERNKSGIWGWRSDRCETINGHLCKVFSATNVELVTRTRMEHMTEDEKQRCREEEKDSLQLIAPLQTLLGILETSTVNEHEADENEKEEGMSRNAGHVTPEEYFDPGVDLGGRDIGRRKEMTTKIQKFKATLWLCDSYPLMLPEQILPIVDLMALSSAHFAKLRDFIQLQLPAGFPVKIEIPLFHVLNASITFGNIFGLDSPVEGVQYLNEEDTGRLSCVLSESCFQPPLGYTHTDTESAQMQPAFGLDEGDALMQYAIQQSLMEAGTENDMVNVWEALSGSNPGPVGDGHHLPAPSNRPLPAPPFNEEDTILQRAIAESLGLAFTPSESFLTSDDPDLEQAIRLSQEESEAWQHRQEEEEETLKRILELSLVEK